MSDVINTAASHEWATFWTVGLVLSVAIGRMLLASRPRARSPVLVLAPRPRVADRIRAITGVD